MRLFVAVSVLAVFLAGCGSKSEYVKKGELAQTIEQESIQKTYIEAIGICGADAKLTSDSQTRSDSRDCGLTKAQGELAPLIFSALNWKGA